MPALLEYLARADTIHCTAGVGPTKVGVAVGVGVRMGVGAGTGACCLLFNYVCHGCHENYLQCLQHPTHRQSASPPGCVVNFNSTWVSKSSMAISPSPLVYLPPLPPPSSPSPTSASASSSSPPQA